MRQKGFATLEVILMILVIAILASIAVPRFSAVSASANTAKIQADLSAIDTALALYYVDYGTYPTDINKLKPYLRGTDEVPKPPTGYAYIDGTETKITATDYGIQAADADKNSEARATCQSNTAEKFAVKRNDSGSSSQAGGGGE